MVGLEAALDRFAETADDRRLGIEGVQVVLDDGRRAERRWIDDIRRDVFSVSKTLTSLAIGMVEDDGLLTLDDTILMHLPDLADTAAPGSDPGVFSADHVRPVTTWLTPLATEVYWPTATR